MKEVQNTPQEQTSSLQSTSPSKQQGAASSYPSSNHSFIAQLKAAAMSSPQMQQMRTLQAQADASRGKGVAQLEGGDGDTEAPAPKVGDKRKRGVVEDDGTELSEDVGGGKKHDHSTLADKQQQINPEEDRDVARRVARGARRQGKKLGRGSKRNLFHATINVDGRRHTFHLHSAGLGGKHPKYDDRSVAHTEELWKSFIKKGFIHQYLGLEEDAVLELTSAYSSNEPCDGSTGNPDGCRTIEASKMGMGEESSLFYSASYSTGTKKKGITIPQMERLASRDEDLQADESDDEVIDSEAFRGKEISEMSYKDFAACVKTEEPLKKL